MNSNTTATFGICSQSGVCHLETTTQSPDTKVLNRRSTTLLRR